MEVNLDRADILSLIKGSFVPYEMMENEIIKKMGSFSGSYGRWTWNGSDTNASNEKLLELYYKLKEGKK